VQLLTALREAGVRATMGLDDRSLKAQLRNANRAGASYALVLGEQEMASGRVTLQDMRTEGEPESVPQGEIVPVLLARLDADGR